MTFGKDSQHIFRPFRDQTVSGRCWTPLQTESEQEDPHNLENKNAIKMITSMRKHVEYAT